MFSSLMKHLDGLRLIATSIPEELVELNAPVPGYPCRASRLRARLCGDDRGQIGELPCLQAMS